jgi:hypothetical protein
MSININEFLHANACDGSTSGKVLTIFRFRLDGYGGVCGFGDGVVGAAADAGGGG